MSLLAIAIGTLQFLFFLAWCRNKFGSTDPDEIIGKMSPADAYYMITQVRMGFCMWCLGSILAAMGR